MVNKDSDIYAESYYPVKIGQGIYTSELPSNIPDGFSAKAFNLVATGDSLENRIGIRQSSVNFNAIYTGRILQDDGHFTVHNPTTADDCAIIWSSWSGSTGKLHLIRSSGTGVMAGDGYMEVTMPAQVLSITSYSGTLFFSMLDASKFYKITVINWATDSITYTSIPSALGVPYLAGLLSFKDRLWGISSDRIYFTDVAGFGGLPETWAATNYVKVTGGKGSSHIYQIVQLQNKLVIFTIGGVFTLLVEGEPSSWILKVLDSTSVATTRACAFESRGIVYYVDTQGVWATNGQSVAKLSGVIEDQFFLAKGVRWHSLHAYEDGMILVIAKTIGATLNYDSTNSRVFYSKSDPVGWTEWNINNEDGTTNAFGLNRLVDIQSVTPKVPTFLNSEPTVYMLASISDSTEAVPRQGRHQLLIFDGGENQAVNVSGDLVSAPVNCVLKTKYMDAGNPFRNKSLKQGLIELYTSDSKHQFSTAWDIDSTVGTSSTVEDNTYDVFTVGQASNLIRVPAGFMFRRCALTLSTNLQSNTSQIKIKDVTLVLAVDRDETELVR